MSTLFGIIAQSASGGGPPPPPGSLTATITFPGGSPAGGPFVFDIANGVDKGDFVSAAGGFTQHCLRVRNVGLANFFVDFRQDASGGRNEVVFWNGETDPAGGTVPSGYARNLPSYQVVIKAGTTTVYSATIPVHYWGCRWRYKSADRPVIRTASQIYGAFFPHMSLTAARLSGNNLSVGKPWSGLAYSNVAGNVIQPATPPAVGTYSPFCPPDTVNVGGSPMPSTTLVGSAASGATTLVVASSAGFAISSHVSILLTDGTTFTTRLTNVVGTTWTLEFPLPNSAANGALAYNGEYKLKLVMYIETGGERAELGAMTEWAADYLLNGTASSLNAIRQHAEMSCSEWPFHLSDVSTSAPLNFKSDNTHYKVIIDSGDYGGYYRAAYINQSNGWDFHEQDSHFQMHPYIAFALTEDPYFLEGMQYLQAYGFGNKGTMLGREGNPTASHGQLGWGDLLGTPNGTGGTNGSFTTCSYYGEIRTVGNGIRNLAQNWKCAQASPPSWQLPQSYFSAVSSDYSNVINTLWTTNTSHLYSVFRQLSSDTFFQVFEQSYAIFGMAIADMVGMPTGGNPSWLSALTFYFGMIDALTNGTSGWNNQTPQPHDILNNGSSPPPNAFSTYATWGALYADCAAILKSGASLPAAASPGNQQGGSMGNCNMIFAAAAMAKSRGVTAGTSAKSWMDTFIDYNYPNGANDASMGIPMEMKCGFDGT